MSDFLSPLEFAKKWYDGFPPDEAEIYEYRIRGLAREISLNFPMPTILQVSHPDGNIFPPQIHPTEQDSDYRLRSLRDLVSSAADSFEFTRVGDTFTYTGKLIEDTPWRTDVAHTILKHFRPELCRLIPQGRWNLGWTLRR